MTSCQFVDETYSTSLTVNQKWKSGSHSEGKCLISICTHKFAIFFLFYFNSTRIKCFFDWICFKAIFYCRCYEDFNPFRRKKMRVFSKNAFNWKLMRRFVMSSCWKHGIPAKPYGLVECIGSNWPAAASFPRIRFFRITLCIMSVTKIQRTMIPLSVVS